METGFPVRQFLPAESWHVCVGSVGCLPLSCTTWSSSVLRASLQQAPLSHWCASGVWTCRTALVFFLWGCVTLLRWEAGKELPHHGCPLSVFQPRCRLLGKRRKNFVIVVWFLTSSTAPFSAWCSASPATEWVSWWQSVKEQGVFWLVDLFLGNGASISKHCGTQ